MLHQTPGVHGERAEAALVPALVGMWLGQALRRRIAAPVFRTVFFAGMLLLGLYLALREIA
jgi:uncharacterized membrane protein YfcA